eukprot:2994890-Prymnesium_polylepis.1
MAKTRGFHSDNIRAGLRVHGKWGRPGGAGAEPQSRLCQRPQAGSQWRCGTSAEHSEPRRGRHTPAAGSTTNHEATSSAPRKANERLTNSSFTVWKETLGSESDPTKSIAACANMHVTMFAIRSAKSLVGSWKEATAQSEIRSTSKKLFMT